MQVYQRNIPGPRDLAVVLLLDLSQSTADRGRNGRDVLAIERESAAILASSLQQAGDVIAVHGFNSAPRCATREGNSRGAARFGVCCWCSPTASRRTST